MANITENTNKGISAKTMPLKTNIIDGMIESDNAFSLLSLFQQITQNIR